MNPFRNFAFPFVLEADLGASGGDADAGAGAGALSDATPDPPASAEAGTPSPEAPAPTQAPAWEDPAFEDAVDERAQRIAEATIHRFLSGINAQQQDDGGDAFDPAGLSLDPFEDGFGENLTRLVVHAAQQAAQTAAQSATQPFYEERYDRERQEGESQIQDVVHDVVNRPNGPGEFVFAETSKRVLPLAREYAAELAERYGGLDGKLSERAVERAVYDLRQWEDAVGKAYMERHENHLRTLADARREPGSGPVGLVGGNDAAGLDELGIAQLYASRG